MPKLLRAIALATTSLLVAAAAVALTSTPAQAAALALPQRPRVLIVGDSYTEGVGATPTSEGYAYKIAAPLGWTLTRDGRGGSGYANPTTYGAGTFATRLWRHPADAYDLVVLQGSSNDQKYTNLQLASAINMTIRTVQRRYPHARILMVGPASPYGNPGADLLRVDGKLRQAANRASLPFVDPLAERWFVPGDGKTYANPTNGHPNDAGYSVIATRFVTDVQAMTA